MLKIESKYLQIESYLRNKIETGEWAAGEKVPTVRQLINDLKASDSTVLKALSVLSEKGLIVKRQGDGTYVSDTKYKNMPNPGKTLRFGLLWDESITPSNFGNNYRKPIVQGILSALNVGKEPIWLDSKADEDTKVTWKSIDQRVTVDLIGESRSTRQYHPTLKSIHDVSFDGLIALGISSEKWLRQLLALNIPTVITDFPNDELLTLADHLNVDPEVGYRQATQNYIDQGYKKIHFVGEYIQGEIPEDLIEKEKVLTSLTSNVRVNPDSTLRRFAVEQALNKNGKSLESDQIHMTQFLSYEHADVVQKLLNLPDEKKPDAILCHNNSMAKTIISAFQKRNIPLVGVGATSRSLENCEEDLIHVDLLKFGKIAIELLFSKLKQPERSAINVGFPMTFINNQSKLLELSY